MSRANTYRLVEVLSASALLLQKDEKSSDNQTKREGVFTGKPSSRNSSKSRARPSITTPKMPRRWARIVFKPPQQALSIPCGHEMKMMTPLGAESTCPLCYKEKFVDDWY